MTVKEEDLPQAESVFGSTGINISVEGKKHLGAPLGTDAFAKSLISAKVEKWVKDFKHLSVIAELQPCTHGILCSDEWLGGQMDIPDACCT